MNLTEHELRELAETLGENGGAGRSTHIQQTLLSGANEIKYLECWIADLQSEMFINCVYCGHRYGSEGKVPVAMADVLKAHVAVCPRHPMSALLKAAKDLLKCIGVGPEGLDPSHQQAIPRGIVRQ